LAQEIARAENRTPRTLVEDRILFLTPGQSLAKVMQGLADKWISDLSLRPSIDFINPKEQIAKSSQIAMTNRLHFAAFDKIEMLANYSSLLKKHFRWYKEHISYSSSLFYDLQLQAVKGF
jgi:hypothetical protein